jgi:hypothetical protein
MMDTSAPINEASGSAARERTLAAMAVCVAAAAFGMLIWSRRATRPLWFDELWSFVMAGFPVREISGNHAAHDINPPLFSYLLHAWMAITPGDDAALRLLPLLISYGTVAVLTVAAWRWRGRELAVLVLAFGLTAPILTVVAQWLRHTVLLSLWSAIVLVPLVGILNGRSRWYDVPLLIGAGIAFLYTHYLGGVYLAVVFGLAMLLAPTKRSRWQLLIAGGVIALAFLPWLPTMAQQMAFNDMLFADRKMGFSPALLPRQVVGQLLGSAGASSRPLGLLFGLMLAGAALWTLHRWRTRRADGAIGPEDRFEALAFGLWIVGPLFYVFAMATIGQYLAPATYLVSFGQVSILVLALAVQKTPPRARSLALGLGLVISALGAWDKTFNGLLIERWDESAQCFEQRVTGNEAVVFSNGITRDMLARYAPAARGTFANPAPLVWARNKERQPVAANEIRAYVADRPVVWVLNGYTTHGPLVVASLPGYTAAAPFWCGPMEFVRLSRSE